MPFALCDNGHLNHYRNQRGVRIKDLTCREIACDGRLHAASEYVCWYHKLEEE